MLKRALRNTHRGSECSIVEKSIDDLATIQRRSGTVCDRRFSGEVEVFQAGQWNECVHRSSERPDISWQDVHMVSNQKK